MYTLKLIDNKFTPEEAKEVLLTLINDKIKFHSTKNFSSEIRTGLSQEHSRQRIKELEEAKKEIIALIRKAEDVNILLDVESSIHISGNPVEKKYQI
ncbi:hypothetical protein [Salinimicrobium terrae]|uniref:hypothetical protein n=1 Tax=Salinimicrobium terrae TaxID=470866 RepID=UPI0004163293|nr:hypothetical protein [Salinimicrobium terrae]